MLRLAPLLLVGCAFIPKDAHEDRLDALQTSATEPPSAPDGAPVVQDAYFRFSTNSGAVYNGLQIVFRAMDPDDDLAGGSIEVVDGGVIPLGSADDLGDGLYAFTVDHPVTNPCSPPDRTVRFAVRDAAGNLGSETAVPVVWETYIHSESAIQSADACEPCVGPLFLEEFPVVVCGFKGQETAFADLDDEVSIQPGPNVDLEFFVNFQHAGDMALYVFEGPEDLASYTSDNPGAGTAERILLTTVDATYVVRVTGSDVAPAATGMWALFAQSQLPRSE